MRSSFALGVLGLVALSACSVSTTSNSVTFKNQPEFVADQPVQKTATRAWNGEAITVNVNGVNPAVGQSGLILRFDPAATNISLSADIVARADTEAEARQSITDAIATVAIEESGDRFTIVCRNGGEHGSSSAAASGCKRITVTLPTGSDTQALDLTVGLGSGDLTFNGAPTISNLLVDNNGLGSVDVGFDYVAGARAVITGEDAVTVRVPRDLAADSVILTIASNGQLTAEQYDRRINVSAFPGMETNTAFNAASAGPKMRELNVQTKGVFDTDVLTIASF